MSSPRDAAVRCGAAVQRLEETLTRAEVVEAFIEIATGLIGSEMIAVVERGGDERFHLAGSFGIDHDDYEATRAVIDRLLGDGVVRIGGAFAAVVPLRFDGRVVGGLVLFSLLAQKRALDDVDRALFDVVATHGAIALHRLGS